MAKMLLLVTYRRAVWIDAKRASILDMNKIGGLPFLPWQLKKRVNSEDSWVLTCNTEVVDAKAIS
ncbi:hypothetical protein IMY05_018G0040400 [Salix suchowensis]|nr:hypothetical protein IMY05_018G0040400 [Salix suchowensis]